MLCVFSPEPMGRFWSSGMEVMCASFIELFLAFTAEGVLMSDVPWAIPQLTSVSLNEVLFSTELIMLSICVPQLPHHSSVKLLKESCWKMVM